MKKLTIVLICILSTVTAIYGQSPVIRNIFMQGNNINTVFRTDGIFNYDKVTFQTGQAGFIWPVSSATRKTIGFAAGLWIGAMVGPQHQFRNSCAFDNSQYTPGNIPVIGQVPPSSVCSDSSWRGYLVNLTDQTLVNGGVRVKTAGGRPYKILYDAWSNWPVTKGAPYVEVNGIPGYQPGWNSDRPGTGNSSARPDEILFMVYMDYTNCTNDLHVNEIGLPGGTLPLGAEIQQITYMFNCYPLQDMYFMKWRVINKSNLAWDSAYFALANDVDVGFAAEDAFGCDTIRDLGFVYNATNNDNQYGNNPPALGSRLLQGPVEYTGNPADTAVFPDKILIGYKMIRMSFLSNFGATNDPCLGYPSSAPEAYARFKGLDNCGHPFINPLTNLPTRFQYNGNACQRIGWCNNLADDFAPFQGAGPFTMNSGDTQTIVMAFVIGSGSNNFQNVCNVQTLSDSARKYYYNDFPVCFPIGIEQTSTQVPERFALYQNYPNPFNPNTKIKFDIPYDMKRQTSNVKLIIFDVLGRIVAMLVNQPLNPGAYEVDFDSTNFPSGVYFYKLISNDFSESKKMILMK